MLSAALLRWIDPAIATLSFAFAIDLYDRRERKLCSCPSREGLSAWAGIAYWIGVATWAWLVPPPRGGIPDGTPVSAASAAYLVTEVAMGVVAYDALFFFVHWLMHARRLRMHKLHHSYGAGGEGAMRARDVLTHSPLDGSLQARRSSTTATHPLPSPPLAPPAAPPPRRRHRHHHTRRGLEAHARALRACVCVHARAGGGWRRPTQVLVNICVQRTNPWGSTKSRLARALHNVIVTWMLTESHTCAPSPRVGRRWFVGVRRHRAHHAGSPYYQQFFGYLDDSRMAVAALLEGMAGKA